MTFSLVTGTLHADPEKKTSAKGADYVTATLRAKGNGDRTEFWRVTAFGSEARDALTALSAGDALAVQGASRADLWTPEDGREPRINLNITADAVLPLRRPKEQKPRTNQQRDNQTPGRAGNGYDLRRSPYAPPDRDLNDAMSF